eukprot:TRINITY_DN1069_c0_g1_i23.p1 TRINITY_DN1069_c0_g1~~TRINITY_DN1069_c0_g1_i23.p1  ORF type:complete len:359 (+),score=59.25 TRINITY_DN1069_c0_g1_i23:101-1177(+)
MLRSLVGSEMCIRDRYQRRVREPLLPRMSSSGHERAADPSDETRSMTAHILRKSYESAWSRHGTTNTYESGPHLSEEWRLIHEMAVDKHFFFGSKAPQKPASKLRGLMLRAMERQRVESMQAAIVELLTTGKVSVEKATVFEKMLTGLNRALRTLREHNEGLGKTCGQGYGEIEVELTMQMLQNGAFGHGQLSALLDKVMDDLCECGFESRREQWLGWYLLAKRAMDAAELSPEDRAGEVLVLLDGIYERIEGAKNDTANMRFALQMSAIRVQASKFERGRVQSAVKSGSLKLDRTIEWLHLTKLEMTLNPYIPNDVQTIHRYAVVKLIFPEVFGTPLHPSLPETMQAILLSHLHNAH